jgi:hypothetical protein
MVSNEVKKILSANKLAFLMKKKALVAEQVEFYKRNDIDFSRVEPEFSYEKHPDFIDISRRLTVAMKEQELADVDAEIKAQEEQLKEAEEDVNGLTG